MGSFDDVLALDDGDDWDDYDPTAEVASASALPPVVVELSTHGVAVRLRGEVSADVVDAFSAVGDDRPVTRGVDLVLAAGGVTDHHGDVLGTRRPDESDLDMVRRVVIDAVRDVDDHVVRLRAAAVAAEGDARRGIVVLHPDDAVRHRLVADIVGSGAGTFVTADELVLLPGSRSAHGVAYPAPGADSVDPTATEWISIDRVVFVDTGEGPAINETLSAAEGVAEWLDSDHSLLERYGPGALDVLVTATLGAAFRRVRADSIDAYVAAALADNDTAVPATALATLHRFDRPTAGEGPGVVGGPRHSLRIARLDESGVLLDGASGVVTVLDGDEIQALETAGTTPPGRGRGPASGPAGDGRAGSVGIEERLARLSGLGVDLSVVHGRPSEAEAYALPNSALASSATGRRPGHSRAPEVDVLRAALDAARGSGIEPVLLGPIVVAHDTAAPVAAVEVDQVDLLVEPPELSPLVAALDAAGFHQRSARADGDERYGPAALSMVPPQEAAKGITVRLHVRLSAGPFSELVDHDDVRTRAVSVLVEDTWCTTLHPVDRFVQACVRYEQRGSDERIAREIVLSAPRLEPLMAESLEASERWGSTRDVLSALRRVDVALPGLSPWLVERATRGDTDRRAFRRRRR